MSTNYYLKDGNTLRHIGKRSSIGDGKMKFTMHVDQWHTNVPRCIDFVAWCYWSAKCSIVDSAEQELDFEQFMAIFLECSQVETMEGEFS